MLSEIFPIYPTLVLKAHIPELLPYNEQLAEIALGLVTSGDITNRENAEGHHVGMQTAAGLFERTEECFEKLKHFHRIGLQEYLQTDPLYKKKYANGEIPANRTVCWAYVQNEKQVSSYIHHHGASGVNALYYAKAPADLEGTQGCLSFADPRGGGITSLLGQPLPSENSFHKPQVGTMIFFPSWLQHRPHPMPASPGWRISFGIDTNFGFHLRTSR